MIEIKHDIEHHVAHSCWSEKSLSPTPIRRDLSCLMHLIAITETLEMTHVQAFLKESNYSLEDHLPIII